MSAADRANRLLLPLVGGLLFGAGVVILLTGFGVFGAGAADRAVLTDQTRSFAADNDWFWPAVGVAVGLLTALAAAWLAAQATVGRMRGLYVADDATGGVRLSAAALAEAVEDDVVHDTDARGARVSLRRRRRRRPVLRIQAETEPDADTVAVSTEIENRVVPRIRTVVGRADLGIEVDLQPAAAVPPRVR